MAPRHTSPLDLYVPGSKAWVPDNVKGFASIVLQTKSADNKLVFKREDREELITIIPDAELKNLPPLQNPPILEGVDDLTMLSYLHEPAVLHNVLVRYARKIIYTYSGIVLVALNPYQRLNIYGHDIVKTYANMETGTLEPHLFAVAENAYRAMVRATRNQSIIVTGESGAGKTVSTKYVMRYFASVDSAGAEMSEVEEQVMATNPLMESFGNAKTIRNNNSSRFGKYIQIVFDDRNKICAATIRTYLLERSRVIYQADDERTYHIFYQLIKGCPQAEREELSLSNNSADYHYANQGGSDVVDDINDAAEFIETQSALSKIGVSVTEQWRIFRLVAAILHLGNVEITALKHNDEASFIDTRSSEDLPIAIAADLLQIDRESLAKWIVSRKIVSRTEVIVTGRKLSEASAARDSLSKFMYSRVFDWLVAKLNVSLNKTASDSRFIGLLDIYGFEIFKHNSFEQFCINYANEKLQQEFVQHVFKLEQELYAREEINWSYIDYSDNQPCIDLIENKMGIFVLLDEECLYPKGTDTSFVAKLFTQLLSAHGSHLRKPRFDQDASFIVRHYAQDVTYEGAGFLEKNKDTITDEQLETLQNSKDSLIAAIFGKRSETTSGKARKSEGNPTVVAASKVTLGVQFKTSLQELMVTIRSTSPHFIRCIKPNEQKAAFKFDSIQVLQQLRACGVLETIKISAAGYPSRSEFIEFIERYKVLIHSSKWEGDVHQVSQLILDSGIGDEDKYQVGKTKIFLRAGQLALLEKLRSDRLRSCAILMQKNLRKRVQRKKYLALKKGTILAQKLWRGHLARKLYRNLRRDRAILIVRKFMQRNLQRKHYRAMLRSIDVLQTAVRTKAARVLCKKMKQRTSAIVVQSWWRMILAKRQYKRSVYLVIRLQSHLRRRLARRELRRLRMEQRDLNRYKEVSYKLENKVVELTQTLASQSERAERAEKERLAAVDKVTVLKERLKQEAEAKEREEREKKAVLNETESLRSIIEKMKEDMEAMRAQNLHLQDQLNKEKAEKAALAAELAKQKEELSEEKSRHEITLIQLKDLRDAQEEMKAEHAAAQASLVPSEELAKVQAENEKLKKELDTAQAAATAASATAASATAAAAAAALVRPASPRPSFDAQQMTRRSDSPSPRKPYMTQAESSVDHEDKDWVFVNENNKTLFAFESDYEKEITQKLIVRLRPPTLVDPDAKFTEPEVVFPAHVIATVMIHMMTNNMVEKIQSLMISSFKNIHAVIQKQDADSRLLAFWLANSHEMRSLLFSIDSLLAHTNGVLVNDKGVKIHTLPPKVFSKLLNDAGCIVTETYHCLLKRLREHLDKLIVPAILEFESHPGNKKTAKSSFTFFASTTPPISPQTILNFFRESAKLLEELLVDENIRKQIFSSLTFQVSARAFNSLLLRKEVCRPRRGVQIQFNTAQIENWCLEHGFSEASIHLNTISQAAKLLQMPNMTIRDIETLMDTCYLLNAAQIHKLLTNFRTDDQDRSVPAPVLDFVNKNTLEEHDLYLDMNGSHTQFVLPPPQTKTKIHRFIPADLHLEVLSYV